MNKSEETKTNEESGLFLGSEPIDGVYDRRASGQGDDDSKDGGLLGDKSDSDKGDSDSTDSGGKKDSDMTDGGGDSGGDRRDADGRD